jgi:hypothetical protein
MADDLRVMRLLIRVTAWIMDRIPQIWAHADSWLLYPSFPALRDLRLDQWQAQRDSSPLPPPRRARLPPTAEEALLHRE